MSEVQSEPKCECTSSGMCNRYGIVQTEYALSICQGKQWNGRPCPKDKSDAYKLLWRKRRDNPDLDANNNPKSPLVRNTNQSSSSPSTVKSLEVIRTPCIHEGDILEPCQGCNSEGRHTRECDLFGTCTYISCGKKVGAICSSCNKYTPDPPLLSTSQ